VKHRNAESSFFKTFHVSRFTNNGLRLWAVGVGLAVVIAMVWTMTQLAEASPEQGLEPQRPVPAEALKKSEGELSEQETELAQGPALIVPEEMVAMFQQRKQDLERREKAVRVAEGQLAILKAEVEQILSKVEAVEKRRIDQEKAVEAQQTSQGKQAGDARTQKLTQLAKMYESMPAEEAAARIERMADRKALEILRLLKSKSAGAILAQVKVDRAAKLTEELLATSKEP
jgi:flagellar motility protein MotE (MotC chaperone)